MPTAETGAPSALTSARLAALISRLEAVAAVAGQGYSIADLCQRWKIGADKIHTLIHRGELVAVNVALNTSARPQWRVTPEAVAAFESKRTSAPPPQVKRRKRRSTDVDYFPDY